MSVTNLKLKVLPVYPTQIIGAGGIQVAQAAGIATISFNPAALGLSSVNVPLTDGVAAVGVATLASREDHVHPTDASRAGVNGPFLTNNTANPIGVSAGGGGSVSQLTSKATGVTLSKLSGQITLNGAALAAGAIVSFVMTNTLIATTDVLILNHAQGGTPGAYLLNAQCAAGSATINIRNETAGSLSEVIGINFVLIKGTVT